MDPNNLVELRENIEARDAIAWFKRDQALKGILLQLQDEKIIQIVVEQLTLFLPRFEFYHPEITWPKALLTTYRESKKSEDSSEPWGLYYEYFSSPGGRDFNESLELLHSAVHAKDRRDHEKCVDLSTGAIECSIGAQHVEYWAARHPQDWQDWQQAEKDNQIDGHPALLKYATNVEAQEYVQGIWHDLANRLEFPISHT